MSTVQNKIVYRENKMHEYCKGAVKMLTDGERPADRAGDTVLILGNINIKLWNISDTGEGTSCKRR